MLDPYTAGPHRCAACGYWHHTASLCLDPIRPATRADRRRARAAGVRRHRLPTQRLRDAAAIVLILAISASTILAGLYTWGQR